MSCCKQVKGRRAYLAWSAGSLVLAEWWAAEPRAAPQGSAVAKLVVALASLLQLKDIAGVGVLDGRRSSDTDGSAACCHEESGEDVKLPVQTGRNC